MNLSLAKKLITYLIGNIILTFVIYFIKSGLIGKREREEYTLIIDKECTNNVVRLLISKLVFMFAIM